MSNQARNVLISLENRHVENILKGDKTVELRTRRMNLLPGDIIWGYSKLPRGYVGMNAVVKSVAEKDPKSLWKEFQAVCGISEEEFFTYFGKVRVGYAISLCKIKRLSDPPTLAMIRRKYRQFHPPQFSKYLDGMPLLSFLEKHVRA